MNVGTIGRERECERETIHTERYAISKKRERERDKDLLNSRDKHFCSNYSIQFHQKIFVITVQSIVTKNIFVVTIRSNFTEPLFS